MDRKRIRKYMIYAIGEILLIIIGILIAVKINDYVQRSNDDKLRCIYLNELRYTIEYDIEDVEGNIRGFEKWNPKIYEIFNALQEDTLSRVDSLEDKLGVVGNYIVFGQRSKTKIEELKFSDINLIENRILKNKILLYQDNSVDFIRNIEVRYDLIGEDLRKFYSKNFKGFNYGKATPLDLQKLEKDNYYFNLVLQRLKMNSTLQRIYGRLLVEQNEILQLLSEEIEKDCSE